MTSLNEIKKIDFEILMYKYIFEDVGRTDKHFFNNGFFTASTLTGIYLNEVDFFRGGGDNTFFICGGAS